MAYLVFVNNQLAVNKQLTMSRILHFCSKHPCFEHFQHQKSLNANFWTCSEEDDDDDDEFPLIDRQAPPTVKSDQGSEGQSLFLLNGRGSNYALELSTSTPHECKQLFPDNGDPYSLSWQEFRDVESLDRFL